MPTESERAPAGAVSDGLLLRAAVLSVFDIDWIYPLLADDEVDEVADFLSRSCERVVDATGTPRWQLRDDERISVLRGVPRASLRAAMYSVATRPDDPVQTALESYLGGSLPPLDQLDAAGLSGVLQLERWVGEDAGLPTSAEVQARLDWMTLVEPLQRLVVRGFFGRQDLLAALRAFIDDEVPSASAFLLEGVGGSGKSTALARLILDMPARGELAAYISFDRGWLIDGGPWALFDEIVRQSGAQLANHRGHAKELRQQAQKFAARSGGSSEIASRGSQQHDPIDASLLKRFAALVAGRRRLVIVLDTLEELARRDQSLAYDIFAFLAELSTFAPQVRVIAAGRWLPDAALISGRGWHMTGLDDANALRLLRALTADTAVDAALLREIVRMLGGNPLSLHLAADVLNRTGENPARLIAVAEGNVQGQLYSRLLEHIRDPRVRAVAHPGLVVRRLTPEVIRVVLAEPCGIAPLAEAEAAQIFQALREEATLCEPSPDGDGALVHRQDVRALMLPSIRMDRPGTTRAIHEAAVRYYQTAAEGSAASVPYLVARREELYHRLMLQQERQVLDQRWVHGVADDLAAVIDELPLRSQLYLTTKVRGLRLDAAVRAEADDDEWQHAVRPAAMLRMERGQTAAALEMVRERRGGDGRPLLPELEIEALERLGRLEEALGLANEERQRASQRGAVDQVRAMISLQARILERMSRWSEAWTLLDGLAALDRDHRARTSAMDDQVRVQELVVLTSLLRVARKEASSSARRRGALATVRRSRPRPERPDRPVDELTRETAELAEATPGRLLAANPGLLRDLAAEVGRSAPRILQLAVSTVAEPAAAEPEAEAADAVGLPRSGPAAQPAEQEADAWSARFTAASDAAQRYRNTISYMALRRVIGIIGTGLPVILAVISAIGYHKAPETLGRYSTTRDLFVGGLCAIAILLFMYVGYDNWDNWLTSAAGVLAIGTALFPAAPQHPSRTAAIVGHVHTACVALLFVVTGVIALWLFRKTQPEVVRTAQKKARDLVYLVLGILVLACAALIPVALALTSPVAAGPGVLGWLEAVGITALGVAWLVKGQVILRDRLPQPPNIEYARTRSYLTLRKLVGWIGLLLLPVLVVGEFIASGNFPGSLGGYYYTSMRGVLVGGLCAVGILLFMYVGYDLWDNVLTNAAGIFAIGTALFPAAPPHPSPRAAAVGYAHAACLGLMLTVLAIIAVWLFRRTAPGMRTRAKRNRDRLYLICGIIILACVALMPVAAYVIGGTASGSGPLFWLEATALSAFALTWLVKGQLILKDRHVPLSEYASVASAMDESWPSAPPPGFRGGSD